MSFMIGSILNKIEDSGGNFKTGILVGEMIALAKTGNKYGLINLVMRNDVEDNDIKGLIYDLHLFLVKEFQL